MRVSPGLSAFEGEPEGAGRSLLELLEFGKKRIPKEYWGETEIRLMATAGLRRLEMGVLERILESCRSVLRFSGFKFQDDWASVITGSDEGMYAWVAANYALGTLGGDPQQTTGIIELGGASAQVTFVSSGPLTPEFSSKVKFGEFTYNLYSHSLLHFGQNVAYDTLKELLVSRELKLSVESVQDETFIDPCTPKGYLHSLESWNFSPGAVDEKNKYLTNLHARGNFSECRSAALMVLQKGKDKCSYQHCNIGSTFIPKLQGKFLATENFFYTSKFFKLAPRAFLSDLILAGEQFCNEDWSKLKKKYPTLDTEDLQRYCFSSAYIVALLHDSLGIALDDERIEYAHQVGDIPLDWALGAFILQNLGDLESGRPDWIPTIITDDSSALFSFFVVSIILIFTVWSVTKWRKPPLKTIYDLEKGRYIVTRVGR
ncbi:Nucleoside phosphatase GDA1/CD39 [Macleaya cordata]|uniref:Nucleoside phosphatase GDA1/CD39 n=1 Tax=Macleaya cordata TaxID=56857 RepID=A0A200QEX5_MACCD|nr:Nucleoside phosphatase GDA1/CD39 [Macleaya cordata]